MHNAHAGESSSFESVWAAAARETTPAGAGWRQWTAAVSIAAVALIVVVSADLMRNGGEDLAYAGSQWTAPTDFLLNTPGLEVLHSAPTFYSPIEISTQIQEEVER